MTSPIDHLPPQNTEAEEAVLGSILMAGTEALDKIRGDLDATDFYREHNGAIYAAMLSVTAAGLPPDFLTVTDALQQRGQMDEVGGLAYLSRLVGVVPTPVHVDHYAAIVRRSAIRRRLITAAGRIASRAYDESIDLDAVLTESVEDLARVSVRAGGMDVSTPEDQRDLMVRWAADLGEKKRPGLSTGFYRFDRLTGGLRPGGLYVIGAPTGVGKTSWMQSVARFLRQQGRRVLFASSEMTTLELAKRSTAAVLGRDLNEVENELAGEHPDGDLVNAVSEAIWGVNTVSPHVYHGGSMTVDKIRRRALRLQADGGLDCVFVDYLQRLDDQDRTARNREQQVTQIAKHLKTLAGDLSVPVVVAAQFSRACTYRDNKTPVLSDFRESGGIENEADVAMGLYRESRFNPTASAEEAWLYVMKNRHGREGLRLQLRWLGATCTYAEPCGEDGGLR